MQALIIVAMVAAIVPMTQAPPPTKAEQFQDAARKGDAATVNKLLDEGVDVNTKFRYNATALFYACDHGHLEVVKVLLDHGADMTHQGHLLRLHAAHARRPARRRRRSRSTPRSPSC